MKATVQLVAILELPDDNRLAFVSSMYQRDDGQAVAEVLADVEEDLTGNTRERLIAGLRAALDREVRGRVPRRLAARLRRAG
jgi:hypothetical protein